ncbi:carbohydrate ABC transporter membrane protein 1 (CUT1 family) [Asanoa ferruginea]|uniref:Carbohydrate ABC transporter membrane protein 1 (CUT1 family) n=1 Tax=Asanoa ferruginea TaxID=53367 RepID=A0A3D9ZJ64_9ACTN|nr:sugar ABC transporter permease [Asanoa ferruginea]REF97476.1 carbohydrate ABC transporter membrane protein 1 (CUT1 family) [Asanoa ferruginea]GIF48240.1 sugar ABC transporter permease [Asanoa ferruginea]
MTDLATKPLRRPTGRRKGVTKPSGWWGLAFVAPATIGLLVLYVWPFLSTLIDSFQDVPAFGPATFVGVDNYTALVHDPEFWKAFGNSALYTAIALVGVPVAIALAALIEQVGRGRAIYRVLFFLPVVTLPVAIGMVWRFIYNGDFGLLNTVLSWVGIDGQFWVADPRFTIYAFGVVGIWMGLGINLIILGAGLQAIPKAVYEASALDGAGRVRQFFRITLPLLSPSIFFVTVLTVIGALQMFDLNFIMLRGVNNTALADSKTIVYLFYEKAFVQFHQGYGAAIAVVLLVVIMIATALQFRLQKSWVFYD